MRNFSEAVQLVERLSDEAGSDDSIATRAASSAPRLSKPIYSSTNEHDVLPYIRTVAAHRPSIVKQSSVAISFTRMSSRFSNS